LPACTVLVLDKKVIEEVWPKKQADYSMIRVFRCPEYVHISNEERSKRDSKLKTCIFLKYEKEVKGYKLWDLEAQNVVINGTWCLMRLYAKEFQGR
jgi:hypothetical protein